MFVWVWEHGRSRTGKGRSRGAGVLSLPVPPFVGSDAFLILFWVVLFSPFLLREGAAFRLFFFGWHCFLSFLFLLLPAVCVALGSLRLVCRFVSFVSHFSFKFVAFFRVILLAVCSVLLFVLFRFLSFHFSILFRFCFIFSFFLS